MNPPMRSLTAVILAGGHGTRLGALTERECKPALPFGGHCRNIDFSLSNCVNSGIRQIGVATQYRPETLTQHLNDAWQPIAERFGATIEEWPALSCSADGYQGTADAVYQNWANIVRSGASHVLVLAGDHIYAMDYSALLETHTTRSADVTIACVEVSISEARQFGVVAIDDTQRISCFNEKPEYPEAIPGKPDRALASMGIYLFSTDYLQRALQLDAHAPYSSHDFGRDIIPSLIKAGSVYAHTFNSSSAVGRGYWRDVGTLSSYWQAHMELLGPDATLMHAQSPWPVLTAPRSTSQKHSDQNLATRRNTIVGRDCSISGAFISHSVLGSDVRIGPHSCIRNSVVLPGTRIGRNCYLDQVIVASDCRIPDNTIIGQPSTRRSDHAGRKNRLAAPVLVTAENCASLDRRSRLPVATALFA